MAIFSTRITRAHLHLDSRLDVTSAPGTLPFVFVLFCMDIPLFDRDSLPFMLDLGRSEPTGLLGTDIC